MSLRLLVEPRERRVWGFEAVKFLNHANVLLVIFGDGLFEHVLHPRVYHLAFFLEADSICVRDVGCHASVIVPPS